MNVDQIKFNTKVEELRKFTFWRDLLIYFFAFSWIGHWLEMGWLTLVRFFTGRETSFGIFNNWLEPYYVYGFAIVIIILLFTVLPMPKKPFKKISAHFGVNTILCAVVEYIAGVIIVWRFGHRFWDYSDRFMNLHGHIYLEHAIYFGILATTFSFWIYPFLQEKLKRAPQYIRNILVILLFIGAISFAIFG